MFFKRCFRIFLTDPKGQNHIGSPGFFLQNEIWSDITKLPCHLHSTIVYQHWIFNLAINSHPINSKSFEDVIILFLLIPQSNFQGVSESPPTKNVFFTSCTSFPRMKVAENFCSSRVNFVQVSDSPITKKRK